MAIDVSAILGSVGQVLVAGLLLGAGLPALFALGVRLLATAPEPGVGGFSGARVGAWACFGLCIAAALFGIVVIVFGKQMFGA
ncbi:MULTISPECIES: hypothetical protein [Microbacterium]|uniref:Uncharacterized protein n=1 Tax=Microbacterium barkeri TaxID=33917 RepID=A0A9W6H1U9_9MICO|nr:hypothetical protein [Microbacterium barkeri]MDI6942580.1 hypothetical protein [Microbacterium barkeri]MDR6875259.1 hypothetical protein [Microbacterium barkeri]GLJ60578.1 hypothetical protein GCM10017576_07070 [Microbacterium barkeri]